jgi:hypothetical protein
MKTKLNLIGIIAFAAIIIFSMAGCPDGNDSSGTKPIAVTDVSLNKTTATLTVGDTLSLTHTVVPDNAANKAVKWASSNTTVTTVADGLVTAVAVGTASITVTTVDGGKTATCAVTVNNAGTFADPITLTEGVWADGNIPTENAEQWFKFTATADTQYIHFYPGALTSMNVQLYEADGSTQTGNTSSLYVSSPDMSRTLTNGSEYYIKVTRTSGNTVYGAYKLAFNKSITAPEITITLTAENVITLTEGVWSDPYNGVRWFKFTATADTHYIHYYSATASGVSVQLYDSAGTTTGDTIPLSGATLNTSQTVTSGSVYYIKAMPFSGSTGAYTITFNTSATAPVVKITLPAENVTTLAEGAWADGNIPANGEQWFKFTATADTQYIHFLSGTISQVYVQLYDDTGAAIENRTQLYASSPNTSRTVTNGSVYYIRVTPSGNGAYKLAFKANAIPPATTLTEGVWADGNLPMRGEQWFTFTATADTQYIHFYPGTLTSIYVQLYEADGTAVGSRGSLSRVSASTSRTVTNGSVYYIKVTGDQTSGTYTIAFSPLIPPPIPLPTENVTTLAEGVWTDGVIPASNGEQWFKFTATEDPQYIHFLPGTMSQVYVQLYDDTGTTTGARELLSSTTTNTSRTVTTGSVYYIKVLGSSMGAYKIAFSTITPPPITLPTENVTTLAENEWADGNLPSSDSVQWFSFTATANTQYIHFAAVTSTTRVYAQLYDSAGTETGDRGFMSGSDRISRTLANGSVYYIKVMPSGSDFRGTYKIGFNASLAPPPGATPLTANQWADGEIPTSSGMQWFIFTATAATQYIHFATTGTLKDVNVQVYGSSGATVGNQTRLNGSTTSAQRTLAPEETYYIRVMPYSSSGTGTYRIGFGSIAPPDATPLTENQWADGNIATSTDVQWFTFTATAPTQYIHAAFGTLTYLYVQVYNSSGIAVGNETSLGSTTNTSRTLAEGQTYYIRVSNSYSIGTYRIGFGSIASPPGAIPLTADQWADGDIATAGGQEWFAFTATATTQYIHVAFGTLTDLYVQVYTSSGTTSGSETRLWSPPDSKNTSRSLTEGQTYYIRVRPDSNGSGTYQIGFTTSTAAPTS